MTIQDYTLTEAVSPMSRSEEEIGERRSWNLNAGCWSGIGMEVELVRTLMVRHHTDLTLLKRQKSSQKASLLANQK